LEKLFHLKTENSIMPLQTNEIESELSYAYLHAVTSRAGLNCKIENRHADNYGSDAIVDYFDAIPGSYRTDVSLRIQLKVQLIGHQKLVLIFHIFSMESTNITA
jgi:hypothetical protein